MLIVTNPFNGERSSEYPSLSVSEARIQITAAKSAADTWRTTSYAARAVVLRAVAAQLRDKKAFLAELMAKEMGKPLKEGGPEVEKAALCAEHYAQFAEHYLAREDLPSDASSSYVLYQPLGTILGILPWNAPLWLAFRFIAPTLMAGNTCVMKHDPNVPGCALAIIDAFKNAGAPENILVNLPLKTADVGEAIAHPDIAAVSFTGSASAGAKVAAAAASYLKPSVLELGGSDPCVVLADADLDRAADVACLSRMINAGQSCIAAKRVIIEKSIYPEFIARLQARVEKLRLGDPLLETTDVGPLAREDLRQNLHRQVTASVRAGANCLVGGYLPDGDGYLYPPTLLTDVNASMAVFNEETFGPVMVAIAAEDAEHALSIANNTEYGLGAAIWTQNTAQAERFIVALNAGQVAVNGIVKTDPRLPSGGIKRSGYGRELGPHGIKQFVNAKQVWIK